MLYTFRFEGKKYAYDSASGAIFRPDALQFKMLNAIQLPLLPSCPTSLRYELAKFDSMDVESTYDSIYALAKKNVLFVAEDGAIRVMTEGEFAFPSPALMAAALAEAFAGAANPIRFEVIGSGVESAKTVAAETAARLGKAIV